MAELSPAARACAAPAWCPTLCAPWPSRPPHRARCQPSSTPSARRCVARTATRSCDADRHRVQHGRAARVWRAAAPALAPVQTRPAAVWRECQVPLPQHHSPSPCPECGSPCQTSRRSRTCGSSRSTRWSCRSRLPSSCPAHSLPVRAAARATRRRYACGYTLRFPRLVKLRADKAWSQCMTTADLEFLRQSAAGRCACRPGRGAHCW